MRAVVFAGVRTVTPRTRDGMIESLRVLKVCRKTAIAARRVALQLIHNTVVCAPDELRESLRTMTRMQLIRTLAAWRPDLSDYRNLTSAYRITLKSLGRRYLELHDEIADLNVMIAALVNELGIEPGPYLQGLHRAILADDPVLADDPALTQGPVRATAGLSWPTRAGQGVLPARARVGQLARVAS